MLVEENTREGFLRPDQYEKLAEACMKEGLWLRTALELGWAYGWRRGEIFGLKVGQLDFLDEHEKGSIRLYKTKGKKGARGMQGRLVYMTKKVRELLLMCIRGKNNDDFVLTRDGRRGKIVDFRDAWERAYRAAGIVLPTTYGEVELLLHDLRRSGAKGMVDRGVDRNVAMKIGGWQTEAMLRRYHIIDKTELLDASAKLDAEQGQDPQPSRKAAQLPAQQSHIDYSLTTSNGLEPPNEKLEATEVQTSQQDGWWAQQDLNLRPTDYESAALTN
jgi:integrase